MATARSIATVSILLVLTLTVGYGLSIGGNGTIYYTNRPTVSHLQYLLHGSYIVQTGKDVTVTFSLPSYANATVEGNYRTGVPETIRAIILLESDYERWKEGKEVKTLYDSGEVTTSDIDLNLTYGNYILIFANTSSRDIVVEGEISVTYPEN
jgi:hypothetical protein